MEELDNSVSTIKARLEKEVAKRKEYKREVERLKEYIRHLTQPLNQGDAIAPPLFNALKEMTKDVEEGMVTAKEAQEWIASKGTEAALFIASKGTEATLFMERLTLAYGQTSSFLSRLAVC